MKFIKIFGFLGIIFFAFSTKIVIGQARFFKHPLVDYPLYGKNYENEFKQIKKIILVEPNPKITFLGFRGQRVSLKRIARVERRTKSMIKRPIVNIIGRVTPVIEYKPDSITKVQLQNFLNKLAINLDSIKNQQDFLKKNKINFAIPPISIDSTKETNYILFTYYNGDIITGTDSKSAYHNHGGGTAYIILINKKDNTVCYINEVFVSPFRGDNITQPYLYRALRKLKKDIKMT